MFITEDRFADINQFRELLPELLNAHDIAMEDVVEVWALRAYALRTGRAPAALFVRLIGDRQTWNRPQDEDHAQGELARLGTAAPPTIELDRDGLIVEIRCYVGQFLPGGHEVLNMGIQHQRDGLVSWQRHSDIELAAIVGDLRAGRRGEAPRLLSPSDAARELGGTSLSDLLKKQGGGSS